MLEQEREHWIDICKGIAIILVVVGHVVSSYHNSNLLLKSDGFNFIQTFVYSFHMPLFFFISGYLFEISKKNKSKKERIIDKLISYGIPYFIFSIIYFFMKLVTSNFVNTKLSICDLLLIPIFPISFMWYLYALMFMSILLIIFLKKKQRIIIFMISIVLKLITEILFSNKTFTNSIYKNLFVFDIMKDLVWFVSGILFWDYRFMEKIKKLSQNGMVIFGTIIIFIVMNIVTYVLKIKYVFIIDIIFAMIGIVLTILISLRMKNNNTIENIGKNTMPIYLMHGIIIAIVRIVLVKLKVPLLEGIIPLLVCTAIGIIGSLLIYKLLGKWKITDFIFYPRKYIKR